MDEVEDEAEKERNMAVVVDRETTSDEKEDKLETSPSQPFRRIGSRSVEAEVGGRREGDEATLRAMAESAILEPRTKWRRIW